MESWGMLLAPVHRHDLLSFMVGRLPKAASELDWLENDVWNS